MEQATTLAELHVIETEFDSRFSKVWDGRFSEFGQRIGYGIRKGKWIVSSRLMSEQLCRSEQENIVGHGQ